MALEVKFAATVSDRYTRHLRWLAERVGADLADAAVITTGPAVSGQIADLGHCRHGAGS